MKPEGLAAPSSSVVAPSAVARRSNTAPADGRRGAGGLLGDMPPSRGRTVKASSPLPNSAKNGLLSEPLLAAEG